MIWGAFIYTGIDYKGVDGKWEPQGTWSWPHGTVTTPGHKGMRGERGPWGPERRKRCVVRVPLGGIVTWGHGTVSSKGPQREGDQENEYPDLIPLLPSKLLSGFPLTGPSWRPENEGAWWEGAEKGKERICRGKGQPAHTGHYVGISFLIPVPLWLPSCKLLGNAASKLPQGSHWVSPCSLPPIFYSHFIFDPRDFSYFPASSVKHVKGCLNFLNKIFLFCMPEVEESSYVNQSYIDSLM